MLLADMPNQFPCGWRLWAALVHLPACLHVWHQLQQQPKRVQATLTSASHVVSLHTRVHSWLYLSPWYLIMYTSDWIWSVLSCADHDAQPVRDYGTKDRCEMTSSNPGEGSLRLVGGATNNTGVLQVYLSGTWVGICANGLRHDSESLDVECRQLGYRSWYSFGSV